MALKHLLSALLLTGAMTIPAGATTITFTGANGGDSVGYSEAGLMFDDARITSGNCDGSVSGKACMALNKNEVSTLTSQTLGGLFTLTSFWFKLLGASPAELSVESSKGGLLILTEAVYGKNNDGNVFDLIGNALFEDVSWVTFTDSGRGNARVDDIALLSAPPAPVPLPAAGLLLVAAIGGLTALRRKKAIA
jgi:hypothetical protein